MTLVSELPKEIPDRVCLEQDSPHFFKYWKKVGVKIDGLVQFNVLEFCVSEGWAKLLVKDGRGNYKHERGKLLSIKKLGMIEPYWR